MHLFCIYFDQFIRSGPYRLKLSHQKKKNIYLDQFINTVVLFPQAKIFGSTTCHQSQLIKMIYIYIYIYTIKGERTQRWKQKHSYTVII